MKTKKKIVYLLLTGCFLTGCGTESISSFFSESSSEKTLSLEEPLTSENNVTSSSNELSSGTGKSDGTSSLEASKDTTPKTTEESSSTEPTRYFVTLIASANGSLQTSENSGEIGAEITITVSPDTDYLLCSLLVNNEEKKADVVDNKLVIPMVTGGLIVSAAFTQDPSSENATNSIITTLQTTKSDENTILACHGVANSIFWDAKGFLEFRAFCIVYKGLNYYVQVSETSNTVLNSEYIKGLFGSYSDSSLYVVAVDTANLLQNNIIVPEKCLKVFQRGTTDFSSIYNSQYIPLETVYLGKPNPTSYTSIFNTIDNKAFVPNALFDVQQLEAHGQSNTTYPENTIIKMKKNISQGFKFVEADPQKTSDGVFVLCHDTTIDRTSNGTGNVQDMTYSELLTYDFGSWLSSDFAGTKIGNLEDALLLCKRQNVIIQLDLADSTRVPTADFQGIYDLVKQCGMLENTMFETTRDRLLALWNIDSDIIVGTSDISSVDVVAKNENKIDLFPIVIFTIPYQVTLDNTPSIVEAVHKIGGRAMVWTVDSATTAYNLFSSGTDYILTNSILPSEITALQTNETNV
jgi:glycerophosphoryl diester phosphodiesterase